MHSMRVRTPWLRVSFLLLKVWACQVGRNWSMGGLKLDESIPDFRLGAALLLPFSNSQTSSPDLINAHATQPRYIKTALEPNQWWLPNNQACGDCSHLAIWGLFIGTLAAAQDACDEAPLCNGFWQPSAWILYDSWIMICSALCSLCSGGQYLCHPAKAPISFLCGV